MVPSSLVERAFPSAQPFSGRWHVSHHVLPLLERRGSKNSILPNAILSGVCGLLAGIAISPSGPASGFAAGGGAAGAFSAVGWVVFELAISNTSNTNDEILRSFIEALLLDVLRREFLFAGGAEVFDGIVEAGSVKDDIYSLVAFVFPEPAMDARAWSRERSMGFRFADLINQLVAVVIILVRLLVRLAVKLEHHGPRGFPRVNQAGALRHVVLDLDSHSRSEIDVFGIDFVGLRLVRVDASHNRNGYRRYRLRRGLREAGQPEGSAGAEWIDTVFRGKNCNKQNHQSNE